MSQQPSKDPVPIVLAYQWASRIISLSIAMVLPGLGGYYLDKRCGTQALFTLLGFAFGMSYAGWQLIKIANKSKPTSDGDESKPKREIGGS